MSLRFGLFVPPFADLAQPKRVVELARSAEGAGWDGFFLWDHMLAVPGMPIAEPWITSSAIAQATTSLRLGMMVTPLARRRPWVIARQAATLDLLSTGRLVVGVGIGDDGWGEFTSFGGEPVDLGERAGMVDEALEVLRRCWSGEPVDYEGDHFQVHSTPLTPRPAQDPLPIWVACRWPRKAPLDRAARHQGCFPLFQQGAIPRVPTPAEVGELRSDLIKRGADQTIDIVCRGVASNMQQDERREAMKSLESSGMTWWLESFGPGEPRAEVVEEIVRSGP